VFRDFGDAGRIGAGESAGAGEIWGRPMLDFSVPGDPGSVSASGQRLWGAKNALGEDGSTGETGVLASSIFCDNSKGSGVVHAVVSVFIVRPDLLDISEFIEL